MEIKPLNPEFRNNPVPFNHALQCMLCTGLIMKKYQSNTYFQDPCRPPLQMTDALKHIPNWASTRENLSSGACEQHRRRPACASAQSDQRLCYSLFEKYHMKTCYG